MNKNKNLLVSFFDPKTLFGGLIPVGGAQYFTLSTQKHCARTV